MLQFGRLKLTDAVDVAFYEDVVSIEVVDTP
jgi:hypothetical protein